MVSHKILCSGVSRSGVQYPLDFCRKMKCSKGSLLYFKIELCGAYKIRTNLKKNFFKHKKSTNNENCIFSGRNYQGMVFTAIIQSPMLYVKTCHFLNHSIISF